VQPAPPGALQLARQLRQLRERWPRLTQKKLAMALSSEDGPEGGLAAATVSSWESPKSPKLPPPHRLSAYARFFATPRSVRALKLFPLDELTPDEKTEYENLETELLGLRSAARGESSEGEPTFNRLWFFQDAGPVTLVCAQLPGDQIGPFGKPTNPNYTELQTYADVDALMELHGHIRAENPTATVHYKTPADVLPDELTGHLVLLGGVVWNEITGTLSEMAKLPIRQVADQELLDSGEIFVAEVDGEQRQFWPDWMDVKDEPKDVKDEPKDVKDEPKKLLAEDVGLLARVPNPLNANRTLTMCNGIHSRGVYGAVRALTDKQLRDSNERYISATLGNAQSFAILMSVRVIGNKAMTPDFNSPGVVLYQWAQDTA
jgi:hypothetical protein